jgi:hypothetical protein
VVKPFGQSAKLNEKADVCTMLPTTALDGSATISHDSHNDISLFYEDGGFDSPRMQRTKHQPMSSMPRRLPIVLN